MSARNPRTLSYRHHRPSGQAVVTLGGRDRYLGPHGTAASKAAYDRLIAEWLANGRISHHGGAVVAELITPYLAYLDTTCKANEPANITAAPNPLLDLYGAVESEEFGPKSLKAIRRRFIDAGLARFTVNKRVRMIVRLFKWAAAEGPVAPAVHQALEAVEG
ncbi:hypothetical protein OJF2_39940 [Aquisphaera giovannonii]|uniref:Core-binding (CB) domain-containing protein n=1 Tax=Aquisphaera giovannonii TaxID=406548 RepID=A0A5B9W4B6_9BACT|nr:hypothetical protein [Aquisphaera giovannonii]QEH35442.1 hypothetical protein OJF2_39940 [Aquisphaera giovannonii]